MSRYVDVPLRNISFVLVQAGFHRLDVRGEVTYERKHDLDSKLRVLVYTSVPEFDTVSRSVGKDAIRIVAQLVWYRAGESVPRTKTLYTGRVYRVTSVEGVLERMLDKARQGYAACNAFIRNSRKKD